MSGAVRPSRRELVAGLAALAGCGIEASRPPKPTAPVLFVGHGSPELALPDNPWAQVYRDVGAGLARPRAVLAVSAHWEAPFSVGGLETFPIEYDFTGFPEDLYQVRYPYRPAPWLAEEVVALASPLVGPVGWDELRNFDHGVWTPLVHLFPDGDVPVLQVSLPSDLGPEGVFQVGRAMAGLRASGVLIYTSGNATHALGRGGPEGEPPEAWAAEFDAWVAEVTAAGDHDALIDAEAKAPEYTTNHPTHDHWLPMVFAAGAASPWSEDVSFPITGFQSQNMSMRAVRWG